MTHSTKETIHELHRASRIKKELNELYTNQVIYRFALALIGVFIPIYLLTIGFLLTDVLLFMVVYWAFLGFPSPIISRFGSNIGLKHSILVAIPLHILFLVLVLFPIQSSLSYILVVAAIGGLSSCFYWIPFNAEFVRNSDKIHRGSETGYLMALPRIAAIIAPVITGVLLDMIGFAPIFSVSIALLLLSLVPLFLTKDYKGLFHFKFKDFKIFLRKRFSLYFFSQGVIGMLGDLIWPLFIFLTFKGFLGVGLAVALSGVGTTLFVIFVGKLSDKFNKKIIMKIGGVLYIFVCLGRYFTTTQLDVLILSFLAGVGWALLAVPLYVRFCNFAKKENILGSVSFREWWLTIGRIVPLIIFVFLISFLELNTMFLVGAVFSLVFIFI